LLSCVMNSLAGIKKKSRIFNYSWNCRW
jgi:hypothetical protein